MEDAFVLPVTFDGKELEFPARLHQYGYTFKLEVEIHGTKLLFERDEERNWRAAVSYEDAQANVKINPELIHAVAEVIEEITNDK